MKRIFVVVIVLLLCVFLCFLGGWCFLGGGCFFKVGCCGVFVLSLFVLFLFV